MEAHVCDVCKWKWPMYGDSPIRCPKCRTRNWNQVEKPPKMIIAPKPKATEKPKPALSTERCTKPDHLVFQNGDSWVCMTCKKEQ